MVVLFALSAGSPRELLFVVIAQTGLPFAARAVQPGSLAVVRRRETAHQFAVVEFAAVYRLAFVVSSRQVHGLTAALGAIFGVAPGSATDRPIAPPAHTFTQA
jgi:hypothetical protein